MRLDRRTFFWQAAVPEKTFISGLLCQTPEQGVELVDAAARWKNIVQVGMQHRRVTFWQLIVTSVSR